MLACAVCPACLTTYAKVLSVLGIGFGLTEAQHLLLLISALSVSLVVSAWRSWEAKRAWPVIIAVTGSSLVLAGHFAGDLDALEWTGALVMLVGGLIEQVHARRAARSALKVDAVVSV